MTDLMFKPFDLYSTFIDKYRKYSFFFHSLLFTLSYEIIKMFQFVALCSLSKSFHGKTLQNMFKVELLGCLKISEVLLY